MTSFDPELERRIRTFETSPSEPVTFTRLDWTLLVTLGVIFPIALLLWGWPW